MKKRLIAALALVACATYIPQPVMAAQGEPAVAVSDKDTVTLVEDYITAAEKLIGILKGIEDLETADAAAPEVEVLRKEIRWITNCVKTRDEVVPIPHKKFAQLLELEHEIVALDIQLASAKPEPWYGSQALRSCYEEGAKDDHDMEIAEEQEEVTLTPAQQRFFSNVASDLIATMDELREVLGAITDKESADSAVPHVSKLIKKIKKDSDKLIGHKAYSPAVDDYLDGKFPQGQQLAKDVMEIIADLSQHEFYGSTQLEEAVMEIAGD